jgi:hypothetical protein
MTAGVPTLSKKLSRGWHGHPLDNIYAYLCLTKDDDGDAGEIRPNNKTDLWTITHSHII